MNDTVARIVEIMFQDVEMTEEVAAIRDEVMNNCQERYQDMLNRGMSEDDAVAAVIESLKGMEEVISQYPKKGAASAEENDEATEEEDAPREYIYYDGSVKEIELTLVNEDVNIERSDDRDVHVTVEGDDPRAVTVSLNGSRLKIERTPDYERVKQDGHVYTTHKGSMEFNNVRIEMEKIGGLEGLGRTLGKLFKNIKFSVSDNAVDSVTIALPDEWYGKLNLLTTSGDMDLDEVCLRELRAVTTSGNVQVDLNEDTRLTQGEIITTSGDINGTCFADVLNVRSTSGDVEIEGRVSILSVSTISGDIDVRADVKECVFKAISGDVDLSFDSDELRSVNGSTISGDVDVTLPGGIGHVAINTRTLSGDVTTHCNTNGYGPTVSGSITTTSGDIDIR